MIDLLVVNYNTREKLRRLLDTLHSDDDGESWKLHVSDNGSSDRSAEWLVAAGRGYRIALTYFNDNIGYSGACNLMARGADNDIIGFLNADTWLTTEDVRKIEKAFEADPDMAILGPKQRDEQHRIRHGGIIGTNTHPVQRGWGVYDPHDKIYRDRIDCVTVSGSAYFIRRSVWDDLATCPIYEQFHMDYLGSKPEGAMPRFPHFYEETLVSYHATAHGYKIVYDGAISMGHSWHASSPVGSKDEEFRVGREGFRAFCEAHNILCD